MKSMAFLLLLAFMSTACPVQAADPFSDPLIKQVQGRHEKGVLGDAKEVKALMTDLEKWTKEQPDNTLLLAYLGSTYTLRSRDLFFGPNKYHYLKEGVNTMDAAVEKTPGNTAVRFVRAVNNINLPAFCNRRDVARTDFQVLLKQLTGPAPPELDLATKQAIYYYAGLSFYQLDNKVDARNAWQHGLELSPTSPLAEKIQAKLSKVKS
jgi:hypothetical protein